MYSEMKKNIENSDAPVSSPTTFAPVSVRRRKIAERDERRRRALLDDDEGAEEGDRDA